MGYPIMKLVRVMMLVSCMSFYGILYALLSPIGKRRNEPLRLKARQLNVDAAKKLGAESTLVKLPNTKITLHVVQAGDPNGKLVVLLHGFPDCWHSWSGVIPELVKQGYFVVAPDMRGYNLSEKPKLVSDYEVRHLTADVKDLIEYYNRKTCVLAAHDWGGVVAWSFAERYPEMLEKLIIMNAPYPPAYQREVRKNIHQALNSWYILFFQIPYLANNVMTYNPREAVKFFFQTRKKNALSEESTDILATSYAVNGAVPAMLNYYKAMVRSQIFKKKSITVEKKSDGKPKITTPTLIIWGQNDIALIPELAMCSEFVKNVQVIYVPNCSHWVPYEAPEIVAREMCKFILSSKH